MKITLSALRSLLREAIEGDEILSERPWTVVVEFKLEGGTAEDSEGVGPDGLEVVMSSQDVEASVIVDTYWNPQSGDTSGNSLRFKAGATAEVDSESYVPTRFDDGKQHRLFISNSPVARMLSIGHASGNSPPVVYLVVPSPFERTDGEDIDFEIRPLGDSKVTAKIVDHVNL